jgi:hypothetical protein
MRVLDFFIYYNPQLEVMVAEAPKCVIRAATNPSTQDLRGIASKQAVGPTRSKWMRLKHC